MNLPDMTLMGMDTKTWMISFGVAAGAFIILLLIRKFIGKRMAEIAGEMRANRSLSPTDVGRSVAASS
ncbi:MAG: hypothetical protein IIA62_01630 [Nitrospinae bacterium]|nr:hypothetical protein [Nitrospinota bacterium]